MSGMRLSNVRFAYDPSRPVLRGVSLDIGPGTIAGLLGPNGAGKTTTFRILAGLLRPDDGDVEVGGVSVLAHPCEARRITAYMPDEPLLYPTLSALENLNLFALLWGVPRDLARARSRQLLTAIGLWPVRHEWVRSYSHGMRQKLALCAALLHRPQVLVMDEPFTGLDVDASLWARTHIQELAAQGGTVLFASHIPELVEALAHSVAILHEGRIACTEQVGNLRGRGGVLSAYRSVVGPQLAETPV
jgi:ABC-2 type transport system ATP-binding protein